MNYQTVKLFTCIQLILFFSAPPSFGQFDFSNYVSSFDSTGFMEFHPSTFTHGQPFSLYQQATGDQVHQMVLTRAEYLDSLQTEYFRFQETFKGLRVEAAEYIEFEQNGFLVAALGKIAEFDSLRTAQPLIAEDLALDNLLSFAYEVGTEFAWLDEDWEQDLRQNTGDSTATYYPTGELMWALDNYADLRWHIDDSRYRLAWRFEILTLRPETHRAYYVDALTGTVFRSDDLHWHNGTANINHYGTQVIDTEWKGGLSNWHYLWARDSGRNIHTKGHSPWGWPWNWRLEIKSTSSTWGFHERPSTTAHWMVTQAWDYFHYRYAWEGPSGSNSKVTVTAAHGQQGPAIAGTLSGYDHIYFGDSPAGDYSAVADVAGHEYTHLVINNTSKLHNTHEQGALAESFSYIFGFMVERYVEGGIISDWTQGEDYNHVETDMRDPHSHGQPETYGDTVNGWQITSRCAIPSVRLNDNCYIHTNSSVQNYWFYLLAMGGTDTNANGDYYNIQGIGVSDAAKIAYYTLRTLTSASIYTDARAQSILVARLRYGDCSQQHIQVTNAWAAVGIGSPSSCPQIHMAEHLLIERPNVYPNPTSNRVNLEFENPFECTLNLVNANGALIKSFAIPKRKSLSLELGSLPNGIYFLEIRDQHGTYSYKIVKE